MKAVVRSRHIFKMTLWVYDDYADPAIDSMVDEAACAAVIPELPYKNKASPAGQSLKMCKYERMYCCCTRARWLETMFNEPNPGVIVE